MDRLYAQCRAAGLTGASAGDDASRLHALFDVALSHGLGSIVVDYVCEVCSDRFYTSRCAAPALLLLYQACMFVPCCVAHSVDDPVCQAAED